MHFAKEAIQMESIRGPIEADLLRALQTRTNGDETLKIVRFASGLKVVYKPKSLAIDAAWLGLTEWIGTRSGVALRAPRVLNRGDWGWAEFIPNEPV